MPSRSLKIYARRFIAAIALLVLLGWLTGYWTEIAVLSLLSFLAWQLHNIWKLYRWLNISENEPPESLGFWSDIFDRINKLQKLNKRHRKRQKATITEFQTVTNAFPDAALVIDRNDAIAWINDAAESMLGLQRSSDLGQPVTNLIRDPDFANWLAVQEHVNSRLEMPGPADSNIYLSASAVSYRKGQRLLIIRDITDIHNLERIRRDFVANVSHELRTPLTVLIGYLESIEEQCAEDLDTKELVPAVSRMQSKARQMEALLNDLLELSRLQSDEHISEDEDIDVPAMLMQLKEQAEEISQDKHQLRFDVKDGPWLRGIPADIESALRNLVQNAIYYTPPGGTIRVSWKAEDGGPVFLVEDTGTGIPKRDIPRLTERFYRVGADRSRSSGGTGLGLAIVKHVMNAHQGRLNIESELGQGSSFSCHFPGERQLPQM